VIGEMDPLTVLVVEDDRELAKLYAMWLDDTSEVRIAHDGATALDVIDDAVDVVLLDRMLPDRPGAEVLAEIRASEFDPRVVVVSAVTPDLDVVEMGFDAYLEKPADAVSLEETIERVLTRAEYDETLRELFSLIERQDTLEAVKRPSVLEASDEYRLLTDRIDALQTDVESLLTDLSDEDFEVAVERLQRLAAERTGEQRYRSLTDDVLDSSQEATVVVDTDGTVAWANTATEVLLGVDREAVRGRDYAVVATEQYRQFEAGDRSLASAVQSGLTNRDEVADTVVHVPAGPDRPERWLEYWSAPIETGLYAGGRIEHYHDVTDRHTRERQLEALHEATRGLMAADGTDAIVERAVRTATEDLGVPFAAVFTREPDTGALVPAARETTGRENAPEPDLPTVSGGDGPVWAAFADLGEPLDAPRNEPDQERDSWLDESFDDWLVCPLGRHGVFVVAATDGSLSGTERDIARTWAANTRQALERTASDRDLRERDRALKRQNDRLSRLDRVNRLIRSIVPAVVSAEDRTTVESAVCQRLTDLEGVTGAWLADIDIPTGRTVRRARAGRLDGYLADVPTHDSSLDGDAQSVEPSPARRAHETGAPVFVDDLLGADPGVWWRDRALKSGVNTVAAVPIADGSTPLGALEVHVDRPRGLHDDEVDALEELGVTIGHAIGAIRRREALLSGGSVVLEFQVDPDPRLAELADDLDTPLAVADVSCGDDGTCVVFAYAASEEAADGQSATTLPDAAALRDGEVYRVELSPDSPVRAMVERGAALNDVDLRADSGRLSVSVALPHTVDVRSYVDDVTGAGAGADLVAKREYAGERRSPPETAARLDDRLTDRQREALRTAFHAGYFDWPRRSNAETVADAIGIAQSTLSQHLRAAERKLLEELFGQTDR
jgi:PAS domain S-box-containing protein